MMSKEEWNKRYTVSRTRLYLMQAAIVGAATLTALLVGMVNR